MYLSKIFSEIFRKSICLNYQLQVQAFHSPRRNLTKLKALQPNG